MDVLFKNISIGFAIFVKKYNKMDALNFTVYPQDEEQIKAIKAIFKALKVKFEVKDNEPYDPVFVERVLLAKEEIKQGKGVKIATKELWIE